MNLDMQARKLLRKKALARIIHRTFPNRLLKRSYRIHTHLTKEELLCLHRYARGLRRDSLGIEIGSYLGASALATVSGFKDGESKLLCVDTWMNDAMAYTDEERSNPSYQQQDTFAIFTNNTLACCKNIITFRGLSGEVFNDIQRVATDIQWLFVDGDHSYEGVNLDWTLYSQLLDDKAIVIFHDIGWAEGVKRVVASLVNTKCTLEEKLPNMIVCRYNK